MIPRHENERFDEKHTTSDGCWLWTAGTHKNGYGEFVAGSRVDGSNHKVQAHVFAYERENGPVPIGQVLDHTCHNAAVERGECAGGDTCIHRRCVRPDHLEPVDHRTNILRGAGLAAVAAAKTECDNGHPFTSENTRAPRGHPLWRVCRQCERDRKRVRRRANH